MPSTDRSLQLAGRFGRTALSCASLFTVGVFTAHGRERIGRLARLFGHMDLPAPELPIVALESLVDDRVQIYLREVDEAAGNVNLRELVALAKLVRTRRPMSLFEIGTFDGRSTLNLAANAPDGAVVHTLDLPMAAEAKTAYRIDDAERRYVRKQESGVRVHRSDLAPRVRQHFGDSATFDFSPFAQAGVDFVFVDGSHTREYAHTDSKTALSLLRGGRGTVVWHDYNGWRGVSEALHELRRTDERFADLRWIEGTSLAVLER